MERSTIHYLKQKGWNNSQIAAAVGCHRDTVRRILREPVGYIDGFMTVRKERRQRGTAYWSAYRRQGQRLRKRYIGRSNALTQARLEQIAAHLRPRDGPPQTHTFSV